MSRTRRYVLAAVGVLLCVACCVAGIVGAPSSRDYEPVSEWERREMGRSSRNTYPDDVRANLAGNRRPVAWADVLRAVEFFGEPRRPMLRLTIEHRYFDWIDDRSVQRERFFLSRRGEGTFQCVWPLRPEWDVVEMRRITVPGLMAVVYGTPERVDGATIDLGQAAYVRLIPPGLHGTATV